MTPDNKLGWGWIFLAVFGVRVFGIRGRVGVGSILGENCERRGASCKCAGCKKVVGKVVTSHWASLRTTHYARLPTRRNSILHKIAATRTNHSYRQRLP